MVTAAPALPYGLIKVGDHLNTQRFIPVPEANFANRRKCGPIRRKR
jgi:hypothetical protein